MDNRKYGEETAMERSSFRTAEELISRAVTLEHAGDHAQAQTVWQEAEQAVASLRRAGWQENIVRQLVKALAQAGHWQEAERVLSSIEDRYWREITVRSLAKAYVKVGLWQKAEQVTISLPDGSYRMVAMRSLARDFAQARRFQDAERIASSITDAVQQAAAFHQIATILAKAGHQSEAESMRHKAASVLATIPPETGGRWDQVAARRDLVAALTQAHLWQEAEQVAAVPFPAVYHRDMLLHDLTIAMIHAHLWQEAERVASSIDSPLERAMAFRELALALMKTRQDAQAHRVWQEFERVASTLTISSIRDLLFLYSVEALAHLQQWQEAEQMATSMAFVPYRTQALQVLTTALAKANHLDEAERIKLLVSEAPSRADHRDSTPVESRGHQHDSVSFVSRFKSLLEKLLKDIWFVFH